MKPIIVEDFGNQTVLVGATVTLKCRVISDLHPDIFWVKHYYVNGSYEDANGAGYFTEVQVFKKKKKTKKPASAFASALATNGTSRVSLHEPSDPVTSWTN